MFMDYRIVDNTNKGEKYMLTVFTPTYNRANYLYKLYQTINKQSNYIKEWIIIDDGSTDDTEEVVKSIIKVVLKYD